MNYLNILLFVVFVIVLYVCHVYCCLLFVFVRYRPRSSWRSKLKNNNLTKLNWTIFVFTETSFNFS